MPIDKSTPVPLYYQLAEHIRGRIDAGHLAPGAQLPSERELGEEWGISRMTARQAITYLVRQGRLVARPGIGTFVAEPKLTHDTWHLLGFTEEMLRQGQAAYSRVIEQTRLAAPADVARRLGLGAEAAVTKIVRLRYSGTTPLLLETVFVAQSLAPRLEQADLAQASLYLLLEQQYGLQLDHAAQSLEAITANAFEAEQFGIPLGSLMLLLEGVTYTRAGQPAEFFKAVYRGDKFKFELESQRSSGPAAHGALPRLSVVMR
jgi:GntR family transcriptional regulator